MSRITLSQLEKVQSLLRTSTKGIHLLFDNATIVEVLKKAKEKDLDADFNNEKKMQNIHKTMMELMEEDSYYDKIAYLKKLDKKTHDLLLCTYFHLLEKTILISGHTCH